MTYSQALRFTLLSAIVFAFLFLGLSLLGDWIWERPFSAVNNFLTTPIAFVLYWVLAAYKKKVKPT